MFHHKWLLSFFAKKALTENSVTLGGSQESTHILGFVKGSQFCGKFLNSFSVVEIHL